MRLRLLTACFGALLLAGCGVSGNFRHDPGYAEFDAFGSLDGHREIGLSFGPLPLALARLVLNDEPDVGAALRELRAVRVYVYDNIGDAERVEQQVAAVRQGLLDDGWAAIATIRDGDDRVSILLRPNTEGQGNRGLTVLAQDESELVLVNLIGNVRLDEFANYMTELDIPLPKGDIELETWRASAPAAF